MINLPDIRVKVGSNLRYVPNQIQMYMADCSL